MSIATITPSCLTRTMQIQLLMVTTAECTKRPTRACIGPSLNNGLAITQFYSGAVFTNGPTYYGGTQDNGHLKYSGSGSTWTESVSGDGGYTAQDQTNSLVSYEEYVYLEMAKTTDGGVTWNNCVNGLSDANNENDCLLSHRLR